MKKWKDLSLAKRLMGAMIILIVVLMCTIMATLIQAERKALNNISQKVSSLSHSVQASQDEALGRIAQKQMEMDLQTLQAKGQSICAFVAQLSPVPLLTFDTERLHSYCIQACGDADAVLSYVTDAQGAIQTEYIDWDILKEHQLTQEASTEKDETH